MHEDRHIWEEFKAGKEYALSYIYNQNVDFLFFYGKRFTRDEELVLDIIQDLFYDLIRSKKKLGETNNIRLYLITSFRRKLIRELQRAKEHLLNDQEIEVLPAILFSVEEEFILTEEKSQRLNVIQKAIKELTLKQREILYYKFNLGYDYEQISAIMDISNDNCRQLVHRSIQTLKKYLAERKFIFFHICYKVKQK